MEGYSLSYIQMILKSENHYTACENGVSIVIIVCSYDMTEVVSSANELKHKVMRYMTSCMSLNVPVKS